MGRWDDRPDDSSDDWRGWKKGKYDSRYRGVKNRGRNYSSTRSSSKAGKFIGILVVIVLGLIFVPVGILVLERSEDSPPLEQFNNFMDDFIKSITPKPLNIEEVEQKVHELINEERTKNGLNSLTLNPVLSNIARQHSQDMATRDYFEHDSPEGKDFEDRYKENNFNCEIKISESTTSTTYATGAENISFLEGYSGEIRIANAMVDGWMNSPGHRKNILTPYFEKEGIGIAKSGNKIYGTQNFC